MSEEMETEDVTTLSKAGTTNMQHRLVHFDLKGAPPRVEYYEQIFPLLKKWGATGLLMEYEDMFPFSGFLDVVATKYAYSNEDIQRIISLAQQNDLMIIPLVQTFGHFEYVLKHDKFRHLREVPSFPMTLCPLLEESINVVTSMIDQVIKLHPDSEWFHIGADEVFHIGICPKCHAHMKQHKLSEVEMFFSHIRQIVEHINTKHPGIRIVIWDDVFRNADMATLMTSGICSLVEPMVWFYHRNITLTDEMWDLYSNVFPAIWVASAFKGATGPCKFATDIGYHVENNRAWLKLAKDKLSVKFKNFRGIAITGWQRYDHYSILCELLPIGLPSLAICLLTVTQGSYTEDVHRKATADLNFQDLIPLNPFKNPEQIPECAFPGSGVYVGVFHYLNLKAAYKRFMNNDRLKGWMTKYHLKHNYTNPAHVKHFMPEVTMLLDHYQQLHSQLQAIMSGIFYPDTIDEWVSCLFEENMQKLIDIVQNAQQQIAFGARVKGYQIPDNSEQPT